MKVNRTRQFETCFSGLPDSWESFRSCPGPRSARRCRTRAARFCRRLRPARWAPVRRPEDFPTRTSCSSPSRTWAACRWRPRRWSSPSCRPCEETAFRRRRRSPGGRYYVVTGVEVVQRGLIGTPKDLNCTYSCFASSWIPRHPLL